MSGIVVVDKPSGMTSFGVVAKIRGMAKTRKVGHAGTLDPDATGVLPIFIGGATRFVELIPDHDKRYTATLILGITTDTQDISGTTLFTRPVEVGEGEVAAAVAKFVGVQQQIPPMYSAVKQGGKRLYQLARQGIEVERKAREIEIYSTDLLAADPQAGRYTIDVHCSKGTYIRTICHDLGKLLGCGGTLETLRRTHACGFGIQSAQTLENLQALADRGKFDSALTPVEDAFGQLARLELDEQTARMFGNGIHLKLSGIAADLKEGERVRVFSRERFLGLARGEGGQLVHVRLMVHPN